MRAFALWLTMILWGVAGCGGDSSIPSPDTTRRILLDPVSRSIAVGGDTELLLRIEHVDTPVFSVSLQVEFDSSVLDLDEEFGIQSDDLFGGEAVAFLQEAAARLHITVTRIQGQPEVSGSGTVCRVRLRGRATGTSPLIIDLNTLAFFDAAGTAVVIPDLDVSNATIQVQ